MNCVRTYKGARTERLVWSQPGTALGGVVLSTLPRKIQPELIELLRTTFLSKLGTCTSYKLEYTLYQTVANCLLRLKIPKSVFRMQFLVVAIIYSVPPRLYIRGVKERSPLDYVFGV